MFRSFYNESIRRLVVAFGSLFNDIRLQTKDSSGNPEYIRVPLSYGPKEKFLRRIEETSSISDPTKVQITLPRLGFNITDISYDPTRKRNTLQQRRTILSGGTGGLAASSYAEVPYNFSFSLYGFVKNMTDALQMTEQILPYFTPEFNVTVNFNDLNKRVDIPIILNNVLIEEEYEGDFETRRNITTQYDFIVKSYVFGELKKKSTILYTENTFFSLVGDNHLIGSGVTGAISRVDVGVSGPSLGSEGATMNNYTMYTNIYTRGPSGSTLDGQRNIDVYGDTYAGASYNAPNPT